MTVLPILNPKIPSTKPTTTSINLAYGGLQLDIGLFFQAAPQHPAFHLHLLKVTSNAIPAFNTVLTCRAF